MLDRSNNILNILCECVWNRTTDVCVCVYDCRRRKCKTKNWRRSKGVLRPDRYIKRKQIQDERARQRTLTRIADCKSELCQLEKVHKKSKDGSISWQAATVFGVIHELVQCLEANLNAKLFDICTKVGERTIHRPSGRIVYNMYTSWTLSKNFAPLHRGHSRKSIFDMYPYLKRKALKWTRRRIFKRKNDEAELTKDDFAKYMNALFIK